MTTKYLSHEFGIDEHAYDNSIIGHHQVRPLEREGRKRGCTRHHVSLREQIRASVLRAWWSGGDKAPLVYIERQ